MVVDGDGAEKVDLSELERVYGKEKILKNLKKSEDAHSSTGGYGKDVHAFTQQSVQFEKLILEEKLKSSEALIDQLKSEREQLLEDKKRVQEQLDKALEIGAPIGKLLTDQRDMNEGRAVVERKAVEEAVKKEAAEKMVKKMAVRMRALKVENEELRGRGLWKKLFGQ